MIQWMGEGEAKESEIQEAKPDQWGSESKRSRAVVPAASVVKVGSSSDGHWDHMLRV